MHTSLSVCAFINGKEYQNVANISMKNTTGLPELEAQLIIWLSRLTVCVFFLLEEWHKFLFHNSSGTGIREDIYSCFSIKLLYKSTLHVCQNYYH